MLGVIPGFLRISGVLGVYQAAGFCCISLSGPLVVKYRGKWGADMQARASAVTLILAAEMGFVRWGCRKEGMGWRTFLSRPSNLTL